MDKKYVSNFKIGDNIVWVKDDALTELLLNKKYLVISDSYGKGWSQSGTQYKPFTDFAREYTGNTIYNVSESGAGFANIGDNGNTFSTLLNNFNDIPKKLITNVIVLGGFNDRLHTQEQIIAGILNFMTQCKKLFINASVSIGFIGWCTYSPDYLTLQRAKLSYQNCSRYGATYITNIEYVLHDMSLFDSDGIHPNNLGHIELGTALSQYIERGVVCNTHKPRTNIALNPLHNIVLSNAITQKLDNGMLGWGWYDEFNIANMQEFDAFVLNGNTWLEVATFNGGYGKGFYGMIETVPTSIGTVNNGTIDGMCGIKIVNGSIFVAPSVNINKNYITDKINYISFKGCWFITSADDN